MSIANKKMEKSELCPFFTFIKRLYLMRGLYTEYLNFD